MFRGGKLPAGEPGRVTNRRDRKVPKGSKTRRTCRSAGNGNGNGLRAMISPATGNRRRGKEFAVERAAKPGPARASKKQAGNDDPGEVAPKGQPLRASERPFRDAGFVGDRMPAASGAAIRSGQKPLRGAREAMSADFRTPDSGRACRLANTLRLWVTWNLFYLVRTRSGLLGRGGGRWLRGALFAAAPRPGAIVFLPVPKAHKVRPAILAAVRPRSQHQQQARCRRNVIVVG
jgi:hypothetical protein